MIRIFTLLLFSVLTISQGFGQYHVNYDRDTRWFIGLNGGGTWTTQTEVPYRLRGGYGFTFGKSFGMEENKIFSWDFRARFLHAWFQGQATNRYALDSTSMLGLGHYEPALNTYRDSLGYFIPNYRSNLVSGSVELVLNTNRLRQNTGWNLSVFGGVGIKGYHIASDLFEDDFLGSGQTYDYDQLNTTSQSNLLNMQDGDFETNIVGDVFNWEADWMPSFGFGISKQLAPFFALGVEHKMTWTRTNLFDGMPNNFDGTPSTENDIYHYTALTAKFHLFDGKREELREEPDDILEEDPITDPVIDEPVSRKKPIVDIYDPNSSPHTTTQNTFRIRASVYYIDGKSDITFKQDGNINTNFTYNATTDQFESNVVLHPGQNLFEITGTNESGSDYESVIIVYEKEEEPKNPPIVTITNPPYTPYVTRSNVFGLVSAVLNVDTKSQIRVYLNGVNVSAFSYDNAAKVVNASLYLKEGTNTVTVTGTNDAGSDSKTVELIFERQIKTPPPVISFVNPAVDPYETTVSSIGIRATALHVAKKEDLTVKVNGNGISSFSFNASTREIYFSTHLAEGANIIEIMGVNEAGSDMESTTIIYSLPQRPQPPVVTFIDPDLDPITVYSSSYNVTAKVEHVNSAADIVLKINGILSTLFTYSTSSDLMEFSTGLVDGSNVIEIKGTNIHGEDVETTTIIYKKSIPQAPPIVEITNPSVDNLVFESSEIVLDASVLYVASATDIGVIVNGTPTTDFTYNIYTKVLNLPLILEEGNNVVQITGTNLSGSASKMRIIKHKKPVVPCPPTVSFINPPSSPHLADVPEFTLTAITTHIDSKGQIVLKQNGELIPDALYTFTGGNQIIYNATLIPGSNVFEVIVENEDGSDNDLAVINREENNLPCIVPTVGYISPVPYSTVENAGVTIDAQINNHSPGTTVELRLNGLSQGYMTYDEATSIASKDITLAEGSNAISVIVTNECGTNQATFTLVYELPDTPCDEPTLTAGGSTSFSTLEETVSLSLTATDVTEADEFSVKLNGTAIPFAFDSGTGIVTISGVDLAIGTNTVVVSAKTDCGGAVLTFTIIREECKVPVISGIIPADGTTTEEESIVFNATITNTTAEEIILLLNGVSQAFVYNAETNILSEALPLSVGSNTIEIRAENACGKTSKSIEIIREVPCETIVTNLLSPALNTVTSTEDVYDVVLHVAGLTSAEQITASFNGEPVTPEFDPVSGNITLTGLNLVDGDNSVVIGMINDCSKSSVSYTIKYDGCEKPIVVINGVIAGMTVTEGIFSLSVIVTNVTDASDITLKVNGIATDFDFNPVTHLLTAEIPLAEGTNTIDVEANGCEKVTASADIIYEKPCEKITHTLMTPNTTPTVSIESEFEITLSTYAVESADQITVTLNDAAVPFSFNPETGIITIAGIDLIEGTNSVIVSMENACSSDLVNYAIIYDGCQEPVITFGSSPTEVNDATYSFEATISNVASAGSVQVYLNDAPIPFVYDAASGALDATATLAEGENRIRISADGCVTKTRELAVTYTIPCAEITYTLGHPAALEAEAAEDTYNINLIVLHASAAGINVIKGAETLPFTYSDNVLSVNGITLADGANTITVNVLNECSSETITYTINHEDCSTPEIDLTENPISTMSATYAFTADVSNIELADSIELLLNDTPKPFSFDAASGTVTATFTLEDEVSVIKVIANGCGNATDKMAVTYTEPCNDVTYSLVSPAALVSSSDEESIAVTLNTTDVNPESINITLNGEAVDFDFSGGVISIASVPLADGDNSLVVTFGNECSAETVAYAIAHDPCETPAIAFNGLSDGMVLTEEGLVFFAVLDNVTDAGEITVRFNGTGVPFDFNPASKVLEAALTLAGGENRIEVLVNGCESVSDGVTVIYEAPCAAPAYVMVAPAETLIEVEGDSYTVTLTTENVTAEQINVKVNGMETPFTFSSGTVIFEVPYISVPTNSVLVTLENECGTATINYRITYILEEEDCESVVSATFAEGNRSVSVTSDHDLINVILNLDDGSTQLIDDVSGTSGTFEPAGARAERCIVGVWIRSGCNTSNAGEPYGEYVANPGWDGVCEEGNPCSPVTYSLVSPNDLSTMTEVNPFDITFAAANIEDAGDVAVKVNGTVKTATYDGTRVSLSGINLSPGPNTIEFTLTNECSTEKLTYTITYISIAGKGISEEAGKAAPEITPVNPVKTNVTVKTELLPITANVINVGSRADIELTVNGTKTTKFSYSIRSKQLSANVKLNQGVNRVNIKASNGKSTDLTYYITYRKPSGSGGSDGRTISKVGGLTPKLERVSPAVSTSKTSRSTYVVKTRVTNITSKADIAMTVNGTKITNFSYSSSSKIMSGAVRLKEGRNDVVVEAVNGGRKGKVTYVITYNKVSGRVQNDGNTNTVVVALTPKLTRVSPSVSTSTTQSSTYTVKTKAVNVSSKANLTLRVNGVKTSNFSFSSSSKIMSATIRLKEGRNDILIEAVNGSRKARVTYVITYKKPGGKVERGGSSGGRVKGQVSQVKKPEFTFMNPVKTTATVKSQTFVLRTKISNVKTKGNITLTINGQKVSAFTFNSSAGELVATLKLKSGSNAIRITAKNGSQVATVSYTIKYLPKVIDSGLIQGGDKKQQGGTNQQRTGTNRRGG